MLRWVVTVLLLTFLFVNVSCGDEEEAQQPAQTESAPAVQTLTEQQPTETGPTEAESQAAERAEARAEERARARKRVRERRARERRAEARRARQRRVQLARRRQQEQAAEEAATASCHPSYKGACLDPDASDYDCSGGSGDGPEYTGTVTVVGDDPYDLDRDGDGTGCD